MAEVKQEKITRKQFRTFLNVTPGSGEKWALLGTGVTEYGIAYNPQVTTEKWIIDDNGTSELDSYQRQGDVTQKCYKGDPVFEFINELRRSCAVGDKVRTQILDVDTYDVESSDLTPKYKATKSEVMIAVTQYMSDTAVIEYSIYYNGDPVQGTVTISDGTPTFLANA